MSTREFLCVLFALVATVCDAAQSSTTGCFVDKTATPNCLYWGASDGGLFSLNYRVTHSIIEFEKTHLTKNVATPSNYIQYVNNVAFVGCARIRTLPSGYNPDKTCSWSAGYVITYVNPVNLIEYTFFADIEFYQKMATGGFYNLHVIKTTPCTHTSCEYWITHGWNVTDWEINANGSLLGDGVTPTSERACAVSSTVLRTYTQAGGVITNVTNSSCLSCENHAIHNFFGVTNYSTMNTVFGGNNLSFAGKCELADIITSTQCEVDKPHAECANYVVNLTAVTGVELITRATNNFRSKSCTQNLTIMHIREQYRSDSYVQWSVEQIGYHGDHGHIVNVTYEFHKIDANPQLLALGAHWVLGAGTHHPGDYNASFVAANSSLTATDCVYGDGIQGAWAACPAGSTCAFPGVQYRTYNISQIGIDAGTRCVIPRVLEQRRGCTSDASIVCIQPVKQKRGIDLTHGPTLAMFVVAIVLFVITISLSIVLCVKNRHHVVSAVRHITGTRQPQHMKARTTPEPSPPEEHHRHKHHRRHVRHHSKASGHTPEKPAPDTTRALLTDIDRSKPVVSRRSHAPRGGWSKSPNGTIKDNYLPSMLDGKQKDVFSVWLWNAADGTPFISSVAAFSTEERMMADCARFKAHAPQSPVDELRHATDCMHV